MSKFPQPIALVPSDSFPPLSGIVKGHFDGLDEAVYERMSLYGFSQALGGFEAELYAYVQLQPKNRRKQLLDALAPVYGMLEELLPEAKDVEAIWAVYSKLVSVLDGIITDYKNTAPQKEFQRLEVVERQLVALKAYVNDSPELAEQKRKADAASTAVVLDRYLASLQMLDAMRNEVAAPAPSFVRTDITLQSRAVTPQARVKLRGAQNHLSCAGISHEYLDMPYIRVNRWDMLPAVRALRMGLSVENVDNGVFSIPFLNRLLQDQKHNPEKTLDEIYQESYVWGDVSAALREELVSIRASRQYNSESCLTWPVAPLLRLCLDQGFSSVTEAHQQFHGLYANQLSLMATLGITEEQAARAGYWVDIRMRYYLLSMAISVLSEAHGMSVESAYEVSVHCDDDQLGLLTLGFTPQQMQACAPLVCQVLMDLYANEDIEPLDSYDMVVSLKAYQLDGIILGLRLDQVADRRFTSKMHSAFCELHREGMRKIELAEDQQKVLITKLSRDDVYEQFLQSIKVAMKLREEFSPQGIYDSLILSQANSKTKSLSFADQEKQRKEQKATRGYSKFGG